MTSAGDGGCEIFDEALPLVGARYSRGRVRMVAVGLGGGELLVVSPSAGRDEARFTALERFGKPRFLLAPNAFHNGGLLAWKQRYPEARVVAHPRAHARLTKQVPGVGAIEDLEGLRAALPAGVQLLCPPMAKQGETWLSVKTKEGTAWVVCDSILNERKVDLPLRLVGFRPRLITNPLFKWLFVESKADYKRWVGEALTRDPPRVFIPGHGEVLRGDDVAARLREVTDAA